MWTVARRELGALFNHPTAYILLVVFLVVNFFFFFRDAYLVNEASLRPMVSLLPWLALFFVPAVTMRALAEEQRAGTLELVLAQPISVLGFVLGKFVGVYVFLLIALAATLGVPLGLSLGADMQWGVVIAQYLGASFLLAALVSVALWTSSLTRNQVTAFILGLAVTFALLMIGLEIVVLGLPPLLSSVATNLGILGHFLNVTRGVIDLRDVLYFGAVTAAFLALTYFSLMRARLSRRRESYRRLKLGTLGLVTLAVLVALAGGRLRGRLDLTPERSYTLSPATRDILGGLDDLVTIKLFRSREIPPQFASIQRDVEDIVRDFDAAGGAGLKVIRYEPGRDDEAAEEARRLGIQPLEFNVFGEGERSVREGYLGLAVSYAGESESLPFIGDSSDLEYRLISIIRAMTAERQPSVAFLTGHGELSPSSGMTLIGQRLREEYRVQTVRIDSAGQSIPDSVDVLVVAGPQAPVTRPEGEAILAHVKRGGGLFLMHAGPTVDVQTLFATGTPQAVLDSVLLHYDVSVPPALIYDLRSFQEVQVGGVQGLPLVRPYPLWPFALPASDHVIVRGLQAVPVRWASPLELSPETDSATVLPLLTTSDFAGRLLPPVSIDAEQDWSSVTREELSPQILAAAFLGSAGGTPADSATDRPSGRMVLTGTHSFAQDEVLRQSGGQGFVLFQNALDWLAQDEALIEIRAKDRAPPRILFASPFVQAAVKWGNLIGIPLLFVLYGILRLARRRSTQTRRFEAVRA